MYELKHCVAINCAVCDVSVTRVVAPQVLLQRRVVRFSAARDDRDVRARRAQEETERPADTAEPRDPERRPHY